MYFCLPPISSGAMCVIFTVTSCPPRSDALMYFEGNASVAFMFCPLQSVFDLLVAAFDEAGTRAAINVPAFHEGLHFRPLLRIDKPLAFKTLELAAQPLRWNAL